MKLRAPRRPAAGQRTLAFLASALLLSLALSACRVSAFSTFTIKLRAQEKQCFWDKLDRGDRLDLSFEVGSGGSLDIDFWVAAPDERLLYSVFRQSTATYGLVAEAEGKYTYCFSNQMSSVSDKTVAFSVMGPDERSTISMKMEQADNTDAVTPLESEIRTLADGLRSIRDEQAYMMARERTHQGTAESTNGRVMWWSLFEAATLVAVCLWQVYYLKRFFEVKRVV